MTLRILGEPGHHRPGADTNHFLGRCAECDSHYMASMNLGKVQDWYETGHFDQTKYEAYRHLWATSAYRYSSEDVGWHDAPDDPDVAEFVDLLKKAMAARDEVAR
ncbi:hypothetical protein [Nonomuraea gerenzanensis]|uniref:Uncharacterized protein n=1 Tax=Nonomuraea gerenzanensis TaxID=93944 RepID=A0A1M4BKX9_9ACTN|nr:hypothetical protein [Nonomuraea gerenzanensis]UBU09992.1 hypothetical protein LCN96_37325 [Nonomuraea gerenzanensis]SAP16299.1 hypothetical protein BN4615_P10962 [Nonomuraea gerenzanensis]